MGDDFIKGDGEIYVEANYMFLKNHSSHHQESPILFQVKHHTKNDTGMTDCQSMTNKNIQIDAKGPVHLKSEPTIYFQILGLKMVLMLSMVII